MEITLDELKAIEVIPEQFKNQENPPKFLFREPSAPDIVDYSVYNDFSRLACRCFKGFENKPILKKDGKVLEYSTYAEFIGIGSSSVIDNIHAECVSALIPYILKAKKKADETVKK